MHTRPCSPWLLLQTSRRLVVACLLFAALHIQGTRTAVQALPADGNLIACDRDARPLILARQAFEKAGVTHKVGLPS
jgi:hypothetical protein